MTSVIAFLPMRLGSQRVENKNTRQFSSYKFGLYELKIEQLLKSDIDEIIVSTNDDKIIDFAEKQKESRIKIDQRPADLCRNETKTDELISYAANILPDETILWTHVTSPFIDENIYNQAIEAYNNRNDLCDSLMSVSVLQTFLWDDAGPINYDRSIFKWPWTQSLPKIYEVNSGIFIAEKNIYLNHRDRIGAKPVLFPLKGHIGMDIDWQEDFELAENLFTILK